MPPPMNAMAAMMAAGRKQSTAPQPGPDGTGWTGWPTSTDEQRIEPQRPASSDQGLAATPPTPGRGRVDPALMASLPPEFAALLTQYGQFMDIDGDGTPDVAIVPLPGGNAMAANAMMSGMGGPPAVNQMAPGTRFPPTAVRGGV